jgi:hypothetical protein
VQTPTLQAPLDPAAAHSKVQQLRPSEDTVLPPG